MANSHNVYLADFDEVPTTSGPIAFIVDKLADRESQSGIFITQKDAIELYKALSDARSATHPMPGLDHLLAILSQVKTL